eukprot:scaffold581_cov169-Amphora_coffeaeformis.AAC.5
MTTCGSRCLHGGMAAGLVNEKTSRPFQQQTCELSHHIVPHSPFIHRATRKFFAKKIRNLVPNEAYAHVAILKLYIPPLALPP